MVPTLQKCESWFFFFFCNYSYIVFGCFYKDIRNKTTAYKITATLRLPCFLIMFFFSHRTTSPTRKITVGGVKNITWRVLKLKNYNNNSARVKKKYKYNFISYCFWVEGASAPSSTLMSLPFMSAHNFWVMC